MSKILSVVRLLGCTLLASSACLSTAFAAPPTCGSYIDADSGARLEIDDGVRARLLREGSAPATQHYRVTGKTLRLFDTDQGYASDFALSADGRTMTEVEESFRKTFVLAEARSCGAAPPPAAPGSCRADLDACFADIGHASADRLRAACDDGVAIACVRWIDALREAQDLEPFERPAACSEDDPSFSKDACDRPASALLARALTEAVGSMYADDKPLPAQALAPLPALCAKHGSAKVCNEVAEQLWIGGRHADARTALDTACTRGGDPEACRHASALAGVASLQPQRAERLPCGRYVAATGLMSELDFGDRGLLPSLGGQLRARIEDGQVRIRHDKGGDFVFAPIAGDALIGIDSWNRYAVYTRDGGAATCAAPMVYVEKPLVEDCPQPGSESIAACCARGSLHGCNTLGHQRALAGDWAGAKPEYLKVCTAGVRVGCENLTRVFAHGDESIPELLDALCAKDATHVACDVRDTTAWASLALSRAADELLKDLEREAEAELPAQAR
ncbi:hypothetical protein [Lysobacter brunescens]|uniref:Sel1 repeat family protein n=1 Tax=Lysobacter brunescens TaxID=262323 RepID=A0ABW2Y7Z8_9GAMM